MSLAEPGRIRKPREREDGGHELPNRDLLSTLLKKRLKSLVSLSPEVFTPIVRALAQYEVLRQVVYGAISKAGNVVPDP